MMSPFGAIAHAVGPMNVSVPAFETPALPSDSSTLPSGLNLNSWKPRPLVAGIVLERSAVARPEVAVAVLAESVRLHEHAVAEPAIDGARRVDVQDRRLGSVVQPGAALAVGDDADRRARLDVAESRPVRNHAVRIRHRAGPRRIAAARLTRWRKRARLRGLRRRHGRRDGVGRQRVRESLEHESLRARARRDLAGVDVALGIDRQVMQALEVARLLAALPELVEELQALPIEHGDVRVAVVGDVEELLLPRRGRTPVRPPTARDGPVRLMNVCVTYFPSGVNTCTRRFGRSAT